MAGIMLTVTRNAGPSPAQTEKLVGLMESRSDLATGHARTANARTRMRNGWSEIARVLNSDGNGCVKEWKQWAKYWKDKKAAVKRKANMAEAARQRTGGGVDDEVVELSEIERRILTIAGGLSFATGDRHLGINPFPEQENSPQAPLPGGSEPVSGQSESILLLQVNPGPSGSHSIENEPSQWDETAAACVGEGSTREGFEAPPRPSTATPSEEVVGVHRSPQNEDETMSPSKLDRVLEDRSQRESSSGRARGGRAQRPILVATPSRRRHLSLSAQRSGGGSPRRRRDLQVSPRGAGAGARGRGSAARRRLLRRSPPSQRRSEMASLTERFIAIEERRVDAELAIARSQEMFAQAHRTMAEALDKFNDTVSNIGQRIIEAITSQHSRA